MKDTVASGALRMVVAAVKNKEIDDVGIKKLKLGESLDDAGVLKVIQTLAKQRQESIDMFKKGGRDDLVQKETAELALLERYLPSRMPEGEIEKIVAEAISQSGAAGMKDIGNVMKLVMPKTAGRADGKLVNEIVRRKLAP